MRRVFTLVAALFGGAGAASADVLAGQNWIDKVASAPGKWTPVGDMQLPSGRMFVGDPSWGDDSHVRGALPSQAARFDIWLRLDPQSGRIQLVWLAAAGGVPVRRGQQIQFGMDSAYFAFGDAGVGQDLAQIGDLEPFVANDSFEFLLPQVQRPGFSWKVLPVPPGDGPVHLVNAFNDGSRAAVWLHDRSGAVSGVLIDVIGMAPGQGWLDKLLPAAD